MLASLCAGALVLLVCEQHANARLRAEIAAGGAGLRRWASTAPAHRAGASDSGSAPSFASSGEGAATDALPMLRPDEVAPALARAIREHLLQRDPDAARALFRRIASADMPHAFDMVDQTTIGGARFALRNELLRAWAKEDPRAAARAADGFPVRDRRAAQMTVSSIWSETDPVAAVKYCYTVTAFDRWVQRAPDQAAQAAGALASPQYAVGRAAFAWAQKDPTAAWAWATALPQTCRYSGVEAALRAIAQADPLKAAAYVESEPATAPYDKLPAVAAASWGRVDPEAAAQWASELPVADGRARALGALVQVWTERDTTAAAAWIENVPGSWPERDPLLNDFAQDALQYAPELAAQAAANLHALPQRDALLGRVASWWLRMDPSRARAWLAGVSLSPALRQQLHRKGYRNLPGDPAGGS